MTCTASFGLCLNVPRAPDSEYSLDGTRLHDVAAKVLTVPHQPMSDTGYMKRYGKLPPKPLSVAGEDYAALKPYLDYARKWMPQADVAVVEQHIPHSQLLHGTPDLLMLFNGPADLMEVVDLKNGAGIMVDPEENHQALTYAYLAASKLDAPGGPGSPKNVRLTIVQPPDTQRPVKSWDTTIERVREHGLQAEAAIQTALDGRGEFVPGDHCRFCPGKSICPALRGEVIEALGDVAPKTLPPAALAVWLDRVDRMEQFIKAVREVGHDVASKAHSQKVPGIPGWVLKPKRATRSWADDELVLRIARRRKIKIWQDKLMSPAMAEEAHPNLPDELRQQIVAVSSGSNLVRGVDNTVYEATPLSLQDKVNLLKLRSL